MQGLHSGVSTGRTGSGRQLPNQQPEWRATELGQAVYSGQSLLIAKAVSDAAHGGQVSDKESEDCVIQECDPGV